MEYSTDLNNMLCFQISRAHQLYNKFYQDTLKKFNLTYVQYVTLLSLWKEDNVTVNHLSGELGLTNGTLTPLLKRLETAGWIERNRDKRDERRVLVSLTTHGKDMQKEVVPAVNTCLQALSYNKEQYREALDAIADVQRRLKTEINDRK